MRLSCGGLVAVAVGRVDQARWVFKAAARHEGQRPQKLVFPFMSILCSAQTIVYLKPVLI